jgi:disulfide bond formation protein DsbB
VNLFSRQAPAASALAIAALAFVTIAGAWGFQWAGHPPCDLCLEQRYAYYAGVPLALLTAAAAGARAPRAALTAGFALLTAMFLYNAGLAVYHSGVEAHLWAGPTACTGGALPPAGGDLLKELDSVKVVRCDDVGLRVFGLTLANYNILISAALAALSAASALRLGR